MFLYKLKLGKWKKNGVTPQRLCIFLKYLNIVFTNEKETIFKSEGADLLHFNKKAF